MTSQCCILCAKVKTCLFSCGVEVHSLSTCEFCLSPCVAGFIPKDKPADWSHTSIAWGGEEITRGEPR